MYSLVTYTTDLLCQTLFWLSSGKTTSDKLFFNELCYIDAIVEIISWLYRYRRVSDVLRDKTTQAREHLDYTLEWYSIVYQIY